MGKTKPKQFQPQKHIKNNWGWTLVKFNGSYKKVYFCFFLNRILLTLTYLVFSETFILDYQYDVRFFRQCKVQWVQLESAWYHLLNFKSNYVTFWFLFLSLSYAISYFFQVKTKYSHMASNGSSIITQRHQNI